MAMTMPGVTEAVHLGADDIPWVELGDGSLMQLLQVRIREGLWIVHTTVQSGLRSADAQTHRPGVGLHELGRVEVQGVRLRQPCRIVSSTSPPARSTR